LRLYCTTSERFPLRFVDVVELFFRELRARGVDQTWYCQPSSQPGPLRTEYRDGVRVLVPPTFGGGVAGKILGRLLYLLLETVYLVAQLRDPPDAFLVRDKYWGAVVAWAVSRVSRRKLLIWLSYPYPEHEREEAANASGMRRILLACRSWLGFRLLYRFAMRRADHCFVQSEEMKRDLLRWRIPADRMTPVPMGIKKATFDAVDTATPQELPPVVLHLGSLSAVRRLEILVDAFVIVSRARPDVRLRFVGEGDLPGERLGLEAYVRERGLAEAVEFTGQVPIEQAWQQVARAAVCVSPVRMPLLRVASPTKFVEYLAYARPTIGNNQPEHDMIARESEGALTVPWSAEGFAEAILWCLEHPEEARAMGLRGRAWVGEHRTYDRLADMVYRKLVEVLGDSRAGRGTTVAGDAGAR
jgi:glycosyltransferase involved in cell wall biosynthesis